MGAIGVYARIRKSIAQLSILLPGAALSQGQDQSMVKDVTREPRVVRILVARRIMRLKTEERNGQGPGASPSRTTSPMTTDNGPGTLASRNGDEDEDNLHSLEDQGRGQGARTSTMTLHYISRSSVAVVQCGDSF